MKTQKLITTLFQGKIIAAVTMGFCAAIICNDARAQIAEDERVTDYVFWQGQGNQPNDTFNGWSQSYNGYDRSRIAFGPYPKAQYAPSDAKYPVMAFDQTPDSNLPSGAFNGVEQSKRNAMNENSLQLMNLGTDDEINKATMAPYQSIFRLQADFAGDKAERDRHLDLFKSIRGIATLTLSYLDKTVAAGLATVQQQADNNVTNQLLKQISWSAARMADPAREPLFVDTNEKFETCYLDGQYRAISSIFGAFSTNSSVSSSNPAAAALMSGMKTPVALQSGGIGKKLSFPIPSWVNSIKNGIQNVIKWSKNPINIPGIGNVTPTQILTQVKSGNIPTNVGSMSWSQAMSAMAKGMPAGQMINVPGYGNVNAQQLFNSLGQLTPGQTAQNVNIPGLGSVPFGNLFSAVTGQPIPGSLNMFGISVPPNVIQQALGSLSGQLPANINIGGQTCTSQQILSSIQGAIGGGTIPSQLPTCNGATAPTASVLSAINASNLNVTIPGLGALPLGVFFGNVPGNGGGGGGTGNGAWLARVNIPRNMEICTACLPLGYTTPPAAGEGLYNYCVCCAETEQGVNSTLDGGTNAPGAYSLVERIFYGSDRPSVSGSVVARMGDQLIDSVVQSFREMYGDVVMAPCGSNPLFSSPGSGSSSSPTDRCASGWKIETRLPYYDVGTKVAMFRDGRRCDDPSQCPLAGAPIDDGICPAIKFLLINNYGSSGSSSASKSALNTWYEQASLGGSFITASELDAMWNMARNNNTLQTLQSYAPVDGQAPWTDELKAAYWYPHGRFGRWLNEFCDAAAVSAFKRYHYRTMSIVEDHIAMNRKATEQEKKSLRELMARVSTDLGLLEADRGSGETADVMLAGLNKEQMIAKGSNSDAAAQALNNGTKVGVNSSYATGSITSNVGGSPGGGTTP